MWRWFLDLIVHSSGACSTWVQAWDVAQAVLEIPEIRNALPPVDGREL